ncbi:MAG: GAF domain-containing protein, partial [Pseudomonadales bacterium]|nr:GAF domain-containing protein [Pseudomonadales bacterium]
LRGADIYRVIDVEHVPGKELRVLPEAPRLLPAIRKTAEEIARATSTEQLVDSLLEALAHHFDITHSMLLMADETGSRLFVVASRGYSHSGVGSETLTGVGVIGISALQQVPIRIMFAANEYRYAHAVRDQAIRDGEAVDLERAIPMPGLPEPASQLAVPIVADDRLRGVLYVESEKVCRFNYDTEDALVTLCNHMGTALVALQSQSALHPDAPAAGRGDLPGAEGESVKVKYFSQDHSVFLDNDYLIKGVAGAILWRLLTLNAQEGRIEFSNRELRLDPALPLPDISDNLDTRLLLLSRRLRDKDHHIAIDRHSRGKLRLVLQRPVELLAAG